MRAELNKACCRLSQALPQPRQLATQSDSHSGRQTLRETATQIDSNLGSQTEVDDGAKTKSSVLILKKSIIMWYLYIYISTTRNLLIGDFIR